MSRVAWVFVLLLCAAAPSAVAQSSADLRAVMLFDHRGDFAHEPSPAVLTDSVLADPWLGRDKALHAGFSFLTTLSAQYVLQAKLDASRDEALPVSAGVVLGLGLAKEIADSRRPNSPLFSKRDLVADAVGVALAVGVILL